MRHLRANLLLVLLVGLLIPRHACCFILSLNQEKPELPVCPCCVQTCHEGSDTDPAQPFNPGREGPCCKSADQILFQDASSQDFQDSDSFQFWIPPLTIRLAANSIACRTACLDTSPPGRPVPIQVLYCHWTC